MRTEFEILPFYLPRTTKKATFLYFYTNPEGGVSVVDYTEYTEYLLLRFYPEYPKIPLFPLYIHVVYVKF